MTSPVHMHTSKPSIYPLQDDMAADHSHLARIGVKQTLQDQQHRCKQTYHPPNRAVNNPELRHQCSDIRCGPQHTPRQPCNSYAEEVDTCCALLGEPRSVPAQQSSIISLDALQLDTAYWPKMLTLDTHKTPTNLQDTPYNTKINSRQGCTL